MKQHPIRRIIVAVTALLALFGAAAVDQSPVAALGGNGMIVEFNNYHSAAYYLTSSTGPIVSFAVIVRCSDGNERLGPRIYTARTLSSYTCPGSLTVTGVSAQFYY